MKAPLSVSQSANQSHFLSKIADIVFMKCYINVWFLKDKKLMLSRKKSYFWEKVSNILEIRAFWSWQKNCSIDVLFLGLHEAPQLSL